MQASARSCTTAAGSLGRSGRSAPSRRATSAAVACGGTGRSARESSQEDAARWATSRAAARSGMAPVCSTVCPAQSGRPEPGAVRAGAAARGGRRTPGGRPRPPRRRAGRGRRRAGRHGSKPVERATASYQYGAQTPSLSRGPGRPVQHPVGELDAEPVAQPAQVGLGVAQEVAGVDHRGVLGQRVEQPHLLEQADVVGLAGLARADVGRDHLGRVADQQHVAEVGDPGQVLASSAGGGSCAWRSAPPASTGARSPRTTSAGSVGWEAITSSRPGWSSPVPGEVGGVERLVDDDGVRPVLPGPHHRRGDVPRTAPHRDPDGHRPAPAGRRRRPRAPGRAPAAARRPGRAPRCRSCGRRPCAPAPPRRRCRSRTPRRRCRRRSG